MTDKYTSEQDLFETPEILSPPARDSTTKRRSFGPRLPVRMSSSHGRSDSEESRSGKGKATPGPSTYQDVGGSVLGGGSTLAESVEGLLIKLPTNEGKSATFNIWTDTIAGTNAKVMFKFIEIASKSKEVNMNAFIEGIVYQGFNREFYIKHALKTLSISVFSRYAVLGAIRGSNFTKIVESSSEMPADLIAVFNSGRIVKKPKKKTDLTILRFTASIPQWCAYWMYGAQIEKKISNEQCPGYLQFPAAASIPMSADLRRQHIKFCISFSRLLPGGEFKVSIYLSAYSNMLPLNEVPSALLLALGVSERSEATTLSTGEITTYAESLMRK
jgi:hypothetical protein